jgi:hypothetical protein
MNMMMRDPMNVGDGTRAGFEAAARRMIREQNAEAHAQGWAHDVAGCHLCPIALREFAIEVERAERRASQPPSWWRRLLRSGRR